MSVVSLTGPLVSAGYLKHKLLSPRLITGAPLIKGGDGIFCFNYRADRMRQIVRALAAPGFDGFDVSGRPEVRLVTMTRYDETLPFPAAFEPIVLSRIVAEILADRGKTMFRTAETEKYAHVTYFFNRSEEHTSELQSLRHLVCRLLLEKKNKDKHGKH